MKQKLELTWVGKDERPQLEPRILLEEPDKSYAAVERVSENDIFDNRLIYGDNLLALKALEQEFAGKVKCIYIDPPFNTEAADVLYDDSREHSAWLQMMRDRLTHLKNMLSPDGVLFMQLDDEEAAYAKVLLDEVFQRSNYLNTIILTTSKAFGYKSTGGGFYKQANYIFVYAKDKLQCKLHLNEVFTRKGYDPQYKWFFDKMDGAEESWTWKPLAEILVNSLGYESVKAAKKELTEEGFNARLARFAIENHERVFRTASVTGGALAKRKVTIELSKKEKSRIVKHPLDDMDYLFIGGERVIRYSDRLRLVDGELVPGEQLTDVWTDISVEGLASEGGVDFPRGKKPEALLRRILTLSTKAGDLVLDSFAGSGTTGAVAHKMGRRFILVELGNHIHSHVIPRLKAVIDGEDHSGVTRSTGWSGGGGFRYFSLAATLCKRDRYGNYVISDSYNAEMLAQAMCQHMGFVYRPSEEHYWIHGTRPDSDDRSFLYVTTRTLTPESLALLAEEVGTECHLVIACNAWQGNENQFPNLELKKIPKEILRKCEFGEEYEARVAKLGWRAPEPETESSRTIRARRAGQGSLLDQEGDEK